MRSGNYLFGAVLLAGLACATLSGSARADGGGGDSSPDPMASMSPAFLNAKKAIDAKDWAQAVTLFTQVVALEPKNAEAFNYLGFALRNNGDYPGALANYNQALTLDKWHKGAHEYLGEAYLKLGDLPHAEQQLAELDKLCIFGCAEYSELKKQIAAAKAGKTS